MNTAFLLMAQYNGRAVIPLTSVAPDYFNLTPEQFKRKAMSGQIKLPIVRMDSGQKAAQGVHLSDLAEYIDAQRSAARERLDSTNRELAELQAQALPVALPADLTPLLGIGLALALEIIPALLLTLARPEPASAAQAQAATLAEASPAHTAPAEPAEAEGTAPAPAASAAQHPAPARKFGNTEFPSPDTPLPQRIAALIARSTGDQRPPYRNPSTSGPAPDDPVSSITPSPSPRRRPVPLRTHLTPATAT